MSICLKTLHKVLHCIADKQTDQSHLDQVLSLGEGREGEGLIGVQLEEEVVRSHPGGGLAGHTCNT